MARTRNSTRANLGFEDKLWAAADKLRGNMDAAEYKHVVLGFIFPKYTSGTFSRGVRGIEHHGTGGLELTIHNLDDPEKAKPLIQKSFEEN